MQRSNIKTAFGGEVPFTKFIARDTETSRRLLNALGLDEAEYHITPEEQTTHSKRVDLVVRDSDSEIFLVIESQDATGWLDAVHASKITYYMYDKKCEDGVLLCEDADEYIKSYVKWLNDNTPLRITLISVVIFQHGNQTHCEFVPLMRPSTIKEKKVRRVSDHHSDDVRADIIEEIYAERPESFTNKTRNYVSKNNVGNTGLNVGISPYKTGGFVVDILHTGKAQTQNFEKTFTDVAQKHGWSAKFNRIRGYVNGPELESMSEAIKAFEVFVEALGTGKIHA
jgi:hypothetical protein